MNRLLIPIRFFLAVILLFSLLSGCAIIDHFLGEEDETGPAELMAEGVEKFNKGYYEDAIEAFQNLKDRYPYSKYAIKAELKMADALYERKEYDDAFDAYDQFEKLHPKNKEIPYVIYRKGMSLFQQVSTIDREQFHAFEAKEEFERLVKRFPKNEYANRARNNIRKCYISLAEYELYVGLFYFKMEKYRAALERFKYIIEHYPDIGQYHQALEYISLSKEKLAETKDIEEEEEKPSKIKEFFKKIP